MLKPGDKVMIYDNHPELPIMLRGRDRIELTVDRPVSGFGYAYWVCPENDIRRIFKAEEKFLILLKPLDSNSILKEML